MPAPQPAVAEARIILNDISPQAISLFCAAPLAVGIEVAITLEDPTRVYVKGRIVSCLEYELHQHVVSVQNFSYRVGILLSFETPEQKAEFKAFCDMIATKYLYVSRAA